MAALLTACAWMCLPVTSGHAQIAFAPCGDSNDFACGHLTVPLDPSGGTPGTITLAMRRHRAPVGEAHEAVIALAGGPGQAAIPFAEDFAQLLGSIISTRDLIVFDQRGIGLSHPLSCHRFEVSTSGPVGPTIAECAAQIGPTRTFYTTAQTVADIEAIRQAGGYEKLVLYGTSYGTKVAERYAEMYPTHVSALVLDSVVPPNGPEPLDRSTFAAIPRVLRQLCAARACAHITPEPVADLAKVVRRMRGGALYGRWIDGDGDAHTIRVTSDELLEILIAGDLEPTLRTEFPAAVRAAANGDEAPLARLVHHAAERGEGGEAESPSESFNTPLYYATSCEEEQFPWNRASTPQTRLAEANAQIRALGESAIEPFEPANVLDLSDMQACAYWPFTTSAPTADEAPFPSVPTLILSGADDLRTPTANAREVAAQIPGSHLLVVPNVGHSVLGSDPSGCASKALQALFAATPIKACTAVQPSSLLRPTPLAPARLADVPPAQGYHGRLGRTLGAVTLTLADFMSQVQLQALSALEAGNLSGVSALRVGGLRAGWAGIEQRGVVLSDYSYVPGVTVSGRITATETVLHIGGQKAAHGTLRLGPHRALVGTLEGKHVRLRSNPEATNPAATDAIVDTDAQASLHFGPGGSAARVAAHGLAGILDWIPGS